MKIFKKHEASWVKDAEMFYVQIFCSYFIQ